MFKSQFTQVMQTSKTHVMRTYLLISMFFRKEHLYEIFHTGEGGVGGKRAGRERERERDTGRER